MTSSVERKQYDWRVVPERSFFNIASVEFNNADQLNDTSEVTVIPVHGFVSINTKQMSEPQRATIHAASKHNCMLTTSVVIFVVELQLELECILLLCVCSLARYCTMHCTVKMKIKVT